MGLHYSIPEIVAKDWGTDFYIRGVAQQGDGLHPSKVHVGRYGVISRAPGGLCQIQLVCLTQRKQPALGT